MSTAFLIGAAALALGAVIVALFLPARAQDHEGVAVAGAGQRPDASAVPADPVGWEPTGRVVDAPSVRAPTAGPGPQ